MSKQVKYLANLVLTQRAKIDDQKAEIAALKAKNAELKAQIVKDKNFFKAQFNEVEEKNSGN